MGNKEFSKFKDELARGSKIIRCTYVYVIYVTTCTHSFAPYIQLLYISIPQQLSTPMFAREYLWFLCLQEKDKDSESSGVGSLRSSTRQLIPCWRTHLVHIKRAEHLLNVLIGLWIQPSKPKELLKFMLRQLSRRTLCHEFLVPVVDLDSLQIIYCGAAVVSHVYLWSEG